MTVPDQRHLVNRMKMEGLVFRIYREPVNTTIDVTVSDPWGGAYSQQALVPHSPASNVLIP